MTNDVVLRAEQIVSGFEELSRRLAGPAVVRSEPRVYGPGSNASYFRDIAIEGRNLPDSASAHDRLMRYRVELDAEVADRRSVEGRRAAAVVGESRRGAPESRAVSSSSAVGFTTPQYLVDKWASFRSAARAFTDQTMLLPLPEFGLQVNAPSFSSTTSVGAQTENSGADNQDPSGANLQADLVPLVGYVDISQQLYDRGGAPGLASDVILLKQMHEQLDAAIDTYVLGVALADATVVTDDSAFSFANFLTDVAKGREGLADTAGTRLLATHLFTTTDQFGYLTRQVDSAARPILTPDSGAIVAAQETGDPQWNSWTGTHLGQSRLHTDDNIPASGSNTQLVIARPQETYSFIGDEMSYTYWETSASTLTVLVGLRCYVAAITRFPKSISILTGSAFPTSNV